ncbi:DUF992 domain-containing protein [Pseudorhodoplanes sp.]|uniref:DUF992 domain-containing protein n=1 Tax=Pseudorhodoplanes sp. TaxID=1934341 RepID=UPI003D117EEF
MTTRIFRMLALLFGRHARKGLTIAGTTAVLALSAPSLHAQVPPPPGVTGVNVGLLSCNLSPTIGLVVGSLQTMECRFAPAGPFPPEIYRGTFGTLGLDVGVTLAQGLAWQVYAPTAGPLNGALAGTYVGPSGEIGVGVGVGANILFGGSGRSYALQPVSLSGEVALNVSVGVSTIELRWVP